MTNPLSDFGRTMPLPATAGGPAEADRLPALAVAAAFAATGPCR